MKLLRKYISAFLREEDGPTAVEYAVMLALIVMICFAAIQFVGQETNENFNVVAISTAMNGS